MQDADYTAGQRPNDETDTVYSNFDHEMDRDVLAELLARPGEVCAQHAAWDFCGYVWVDSAGEWVDEVWRYNSPVEVIRGESPEAVIEAANDKYGSG